MPRSLALAVALIAAAMLLVEIFVTRIFSVLFFYHYSSFAIALIMSGLTLGGLAVSGWNAKGMAEEDFRKRSVGLCLFFAAALTVAVFVATALVKQNLYQEPKISTVVCLALLFLPGLIGAGAFLAVAFARGAAWINRLYAADLIAAAAACLGAIYLMRNLEGAATLLTPVLLASLAAVVLTGGLIKLRVVSLAMVALSAVGIFANYYTHGKFLKLAVGQNVVFEHWNEHSRILVLQFEIPGRKAYQIVIDKTAATTVWELPHRREGNPIPVQSWWNQSVNHIGYRLGRELNETAIIGVGGGVDILAALASGAKHVDGYELNRIIVDLHRNPTLLEFNGIGNYPEVSLIHSEARVGIKHSGKKYDVIQASMIDTWAATAGGGFVLSENGLYTVEGWETFLNALTDHGVLTMTRWYIRDVPAEVQRLVSLACEALHRIGIEDARNHIILASERTAEEAQAAMDGLNSTIIVSKKPFTAEEIGRLRAITQREKMHFLAVPDTASTDPVIAGLLDPTTRRAVIANHFFDMSAPTDMRPYFFLLLRPGNALKFPESLGAILEITINGTRVLMILFVTSLAFALWVLALARFSLPSAHATPQSRALYRWMTLYFMGIGFGYIFVQLGMHQRLILILGQPTLAFSVVLFSMLLGTGLGSACSSRAFKDERFTPAWMCIIIVIAVLMGSMSLFPLLDNIGGAFLRSGIISLMMGITGFALGFAFPLGVRLAAPTGEWAIQRLWAVNGAATIAGSSFASIVGVTMGARAVLAVGLIFYLFVMLCGQRAETLSKNLSSPTEEK